MRWGVYASPGGALLIGILLFGFWLGVAALCLLLLVGVLLLQAAGRAVSWWLERDRRRWLGR